MAAQQVPDAELGPIRLGDLTPLVVRRWRATLLDEGVSPAMVAKAYRLLRAILNTAVDDDIIDRNPCRIRGGGDEKAAERPTLSVAQVQQLAMLVRRAGRHSSRSRRSAR
jgi:hypothetical protein